MRLSIISVGRVRKGPERDIFDSYASRITWPISLAEVEDRGPKPAREKVRREGELLLARIPEGATVVALDAEGRSFSSEKFSAQLGRWQDDRIDEIAFIIGGADGLDGPVMERADMALCLGPMTWPHLLVRGMLAEQIYRAQEILKGHPYHRAGSPPGRGGNLKPTKTKTRRTP